MTEKKKPLDLTKTEPLLISENEDIRLIEVKFPGGEEKEIFKEGKALYAFQLDMNHAKTSGQPALWFTSEYFIDKEEGMQSAKNQIALLEGMAKTMGVLMGLGEPNDNSIDPPKATKDKETDPTLN